MLNLRPEDRPSANEALKHPFLMSDDEKTDKVLRIDIKTIHAGSVSTTDDTVLRLCYSPMALNQLLVVTAGCRLLKFDAHSGQLLSEVSNVHRSSCSSLDPFQTGHFLATAGDKLIKIWDYHMRMDLNFQVFIGHSNNISKVRFTPDLQALVSIGEAIFIWDFLAYGRVPLEPGGSLRISSCNISNKFCVFNSDKTAHVFDGAGSPTQDDIGESDLKPRPPIMATELPLQPLPSSPDKRDEIVVNSPSKKDVKVIDSFNPIVTRSLKVPNNTPEISKSIKTQTPIRISLSSDTGHPFPGVLKHYKKRKSSTALPERKYTAPRSQAGLALLAILDYNGDGRNNMCWHPETGLFVYTSGCIVIIEDLHDGKQKHLMQHFEEISTIAVQHDVQVLASASGSSKTVASCICIWDIASGDYKKMLTYHSYEIVGLHFSRDDRFLISVGDYRECSVVIWGTKDYNVLTSSYTKTPIHDIAWDTYTMNEFVSVGQDGHVLFWLLEESRGSFNLNVCEGKVPEDLLYTSKQNDSMVHFTSVRYAGDNVLYVGNNAGIISAWDTRQNKCFMHWLSDDSEIDVIVCHRGSLTTGSSSGHLRLWSVVGVGEMRLPGENDVLNQNGLVIEDEMSLDAGVISASFDTSLEMGIVGTVGGTLWYINWTERTSIRLVSSHTEKINSLVASGPDDKFFATCSDDGSLRVWTSDDLEQTLQFQVVDQRCNCVSFCPTPPREPTHNVLQDGEVIATVHPNIEPVEKPLRPSHCVAGFDDGTVRLFDLGRVEMIMKIHPHSGGVTVINFSACGRVFMSGSTDGVVAISSPATGLTVRLIQDHKGAPITDMDIASHKNDHPSFNSPRLWLIANADRRVSVWKADWSKDFCELVDWLTFPAPNITPEGIALKKDDASAYLHLPPSLARFSPTEPDVIVYSGYGLRKLIQFYSLSQRKVFRTILLTQWASCLEISPKGHLIAVGTKDRLVKVIDYDKGSFQDFDMHCDSISHVTFSPTGDKLFSVGFSDVALWKVLI
ncbi:WD repeat-containing protein 90-like [Xenia sp. Carnegie-2017]|uniref:WD repeat-containing protein 90-like n=1 Tax=Xenia sp. Carnegie-2017 TaxID=2897299 RepID=UPI001F0354F2|nr:WD repeat-containing protein 90-like [Xenia sp. Carnegie-2017]